MTFEATALPGVQLIHTPLFRDERGHFLEGWSQRRYADAGIGIAFVQDNVSVSTRGVLRGLHFQHPRGQAKLISVLDGAIWDVAVDVRKGSPTFGASVGVELSSDAGSQLFIPEGFAHGFAVLSDRAVVAYKCGDYYTPAAEHTLRWDDPDIGIEWPVKEPLLSSKDREGTLLREFREAELPPFG